MLGLLSKTITNERAFRICQKFYFITSVSLGPGSNLEFGYNIKEVSAINEPLAHGRVGGRGVRGDGVRVTPEQARRSGYNESRKTRFAVLT